MGPVIVNNNYIPERAQPPAIRTYPDYPPPPPREPEPSSAGRYPGPPPSNEPLLYLIARTDDSVIAAVAYWVDGATLHYVDRRHEHRQMPLQQVDRALSEQLNRERRVDFRLPR
jgi:hypothetical protein